MTKKVLVVLLLSIVALDDAWALILFGIGIAIVLMIFRNRRTADVDDLNVMRY